MRKYSAEPSAVPAGLLIWSKLLNLVTCMRACVRCIDIAGQWVFYLGWKHTRFVFLKWHVNSYHWRKCLHMWWKYNSNVWGVWGQKLSRAGKTEHTARATFCLHGYNSVCSSAPNQRNVPTSMSRWKISYLWEFVSQGREKSVEMPQPLHQWWLRWGLPISPNPLQTHSKEPPLTGCATAACVMGKGQDAHVSLSNFIPVMSGHATKGFSWQRYLWW